MASEGRGAATLHDIPGLRAAAAAARRAILRYELGLCALVAAATTFLAAANV